LKEFETLHVRLMSELDQCFYDTAFPRFRELRRDFKSLHRLKYAQYIARIEGGSKNSDVLIPGDGHNMSAIEVSEDAVECAFLGLDVNKGLGPDGIAPAILKLLASVVKVSLTFVFNL
jgi:hypothetical protein